MTDEPKADTPVDTGQAPATPAPATPPDGGQVAGQADQPGRVAELEAQLATSQQSYTDLRRLHNQRDTELRTLRSASNAAPSPAPPDPWTQTAQPPTNGDTAFSSNDRETLDLVRYRQENTDHADYWSEVSDLINDPIKVQGVAVPDGRGGIDVYGTLNRAHDKVKIARYEAASAKASATATQLQADRDAKNAQAVISGSGASDIPEGISEDDIAKMSYKDMEAKGLVPLDPRNPPSFAKR